MGEERYASYPAFTVNRDKLVDVDRHLATKELATLLEDFESRVHTRGLYTTTAFTARADLMLWWVSESVDDIEELLTELKRTRFGRALTQVEAFLGVTQAAEFARDHQPAFIKGEQPRRYICVYPFVRTPDWYLLDPEERGALLREHGEAGREFPDVLANTTSAFGLGDYEWILCFEADSPVRIVELIRRLRATAARRYTKLEVPFVSGIRKDTITALKDLF